MNIKQFLYQIFLYNLMISISDCWRPFNIKFTNISAYSSVNYIETNSSISSSGSISLFFNVLQDIPNIYTKTIITVDTSNGVNDLELVNRTIDSCEFYRNPRYEPILQVFHKHLTKNGIFPKRCPIKKNLYFLKDIVIDPESLPPIIPYKRIDSDVTIMVKSGNEFKTISGFQIHVKIN